MSFYTKKGDDGTTGLLFGGRVRKDAPAPVAYGAVDEAQAAFGLARAEAEPGGELDTMLLVVEVERLTDEVSTRFEMPRDFVLPGGSRCSAALELARTIVRRAEREALAVAAEGSSVLPYLNRLSSLAWALARWQEEEHPLAKGR